ncbi:hypothetical protein J6590_071722 [Homalodisca vitripennis]|nr:hypothetical protein J6590_071722 [Homalodisca vitripennis]
MRGEGKKTRSRVTFAKDHLIILKGCRDTRMCGWLEDEEEEENKKREEYGGEEEEIINDDDDE